MPAVVEVDGCVRQQPGHGPGIHDGDDRIVGAGNDQRILTDQRWREDARPHRSRKQLIQVARAPTGRQVSIRQPLAIRRIGVRIAAVRAAGDRGVLVVIQNRRGLTILASTDGLPGTMMAPVAVDTRINRLHRRGF